MVAGQKTLQDWMYWMNKCCCQILSIEITFHFYFISPLHVKKKGDFAESFHVLNVVWFLASVIPKWIIICMIFKPTFVNTPTEKDNLLRIVLDSTLINFNPVFIQHLRQSFHSSHQDCRFINCNTSLFRFIESDTLEDP